ncbi:DUF6192 family protein [Streptomyces sp. NPDC001177]
MPRCASGERPSPPSSPGTLSRPPTGRRAVRSYGTCGSSHPAPCRRIHGLAVDDQVAAQVAADLLQRPAASASS